MANPQLENGHTRIANELLRAVYRHPFSANGLRIFLWIMRGSYGWNKKKVDAGSMRDISKEIDMSSSSVHLALQVLIEQGVIIKDEKNRLQINKDYELWINDGSSPAKKYPIPAALRKEVLERDGCLPCNKSKGSRTDWKPTGVQPTGQSQLSSPLDRVSSPLDKTVQPTGQHIRIKDKKDNTDKDSAKIVPPKLEWVEEYCNRPGPIKGSRINPHKFFSSLEAVGWMRGKTKIRNWEACVRTWELNERIVEPKRMKMAELTQ